MPLSLSIWALNASAFCLHTFYFCIASCSSLLSYANFDSLLGIKASNIETILKRTAPNAAAKIDKAAKAALVALNHDLSLLILDCKKVC